MKKKVAIIVPTLHGAGCERLLSNILPFLNKEFSIDLILYEKKIDYYIPWSINLKVLNISVETNRSIFYKAYRFIKRVLKTGILLKQNKYDVILSFLDTCNIATFLSKKVFNIKTPIILSERTTNSAFFYYNPYAKRNKCFLKFFLKYIYTRANKIVVPSYDIKRFLVYELNINENNIEVIYNGVDLDIFNPDVNNEVWLEPEFKQAKIRLISIGRLDYNKNQKYLIELMPEILKYKKNARLFIFGKGYEEKNLRRIIKDLQLENNVFIMGWKENIYEYLKRANVLVISSKHESFGNIVIESLACGTPVVSSFYGGAICEIKNSLEHQDAVKICNLNDRKCFIKWILYFLEKEYDRSALYKEIAKKFPISKTALEYINIIKSICVE